MKYIIHRNPNTGVFTVPGPSLAKTFVKAAKVAYEHYTRAECDNGTVRCVDIYGREPVWEQHCVTWEGAANSPTVQRRLDRAWARGVTPRSILADGNTQGNLGQPNAQGNGSPQGSGQGSASGGSGIGPIQQQAQQQHQQQAQQQARQQAQQPSMTAEQQRALAEQVAKDMAARQNDDIAKAVAEYLEKHPPTVKVNDPLTINIASPRGTKTVKGLRHCAFDKVLKVLSHRPRATLLTGPAGCGKTRMSAQVAEALDLKFYTINMSEGVTEGVMFGQRTLKPDGSTGWQDGIVTEAFENGGLLFVDEMDNADPNLMVGLNQILDGSQVVSMAHRVHKPMAKRHKDFVVMCGANTLLSGSSEYSARNSMDGATVDRFMGAIIPVDYDKTLEQHLIPDADALKVMWAFRDFIAKTGGNGLRSSTRFGDTLNTLAPLGAEYMVEQCVIILDNETLAADFKRHLANFDMEAYRNA